VGRTPEIYSTFAVYENGHRCELRFKVRLFHNWYVGEVVVLDLLKTVHALAHGSGELIGEIYGGGEVGPADRVFCRFQDDGDCACPRGPDGRRSREPTES
jgi:hypothetical protein